MVSLSPSPDQPVQTASPLYTTTPSAAGRLIVIAGPSGVGKGTLIRKLRQRHPSLMLSVSATTRQPRDGEVHGEHYYFVSVETFRAMVDEGALLEWAEFAGNCYGTPKKPIEQAIALGQRIILEIELLGARQVRESFPQAKQIFIAPPNEQALEQRIRGRGQENESAIENRLTQAKVELAAAHEFEQKIINDSVEDALSELENAIFREC